MRKIYSPYFKASVLREILKEERTLSQIAAHDEIHPNLAGQWRDQALAGLLEIFSKAKEADWQGKATAHEDETQ
jgi:transposase-like protein